jgi:hypothetical protein
LTTQFADSVKILPSDIYAIIKRARDTDQLVVPQPFTSVELLQKITDEINTRLIPSNAKIAVLFTVEWAIYFRMLGFSNVTVITEKFDPIIARMADKELFKYKTLDQVKNMRFNVVAGNPPFSDGQGNKLLYPDFFKKSLDMADLVIMIMPLNLDTNQTKLKSHNRLVKLHNIFISDDISSYFDKISVGKMSYIIASTETKNSVELNNVDKLSSVPTLFPSRKRMSSIKSTGNVVIAKQLTSNKITVIHKVLKNDIEFEMVNRSSISTTKSKSTSPYLCLLNHTPSQGKFNVHIVKNDGSIALGKWVFAIEASSLKEAKLLRDHIQSDIIINHVKELMKALKSHTANKQIISRLPWFE